jgi:parvulin-like peptidyl-prolyl isomerase
MNASRLISFKIFFILVLLMTGCQSTPTVTPGNTPIPTHTIPVPPSETPIPLAAVVNGEPITLEEFKSELARFQDSRGTDLATQDEGSQIVIRALIENLLLAQGALSHGKVIEENNLDQEIEQLIKDMGGEARYLQWLEQNHYTTDAFRQAFRREILATKMIEEILSKVPLTELHAHARHILVATQEEAERIRQELLAGADFVEMAVIYSMDLSTRPAGGDLGWFPRGTLTMPDVEEAIFQLDLDEISEVIVSELGYHIVQLFGLEERELSYEALSQRKQQAIENWIEEQWDQAQIEIFQLQE